MNDCYDGLRKCMCLLMTYDSGLVNSEELASRAERSGAGAATIQ